MSTTNNNNEIIYDNKEFEILFWKVIHNVYLFKYIFKQLQETQFYYSDCKDYNFDDKIKFKDLTYLRSFFDYKLVGLLKLKLHANEYIDICSFGITALVKYTNATKDLSVFKLLMEKKPYQMEGEKLVRSAIIYRNLEILQIAINEPYNFNVDLVLHLEFAIILKSNDSILTILINKLEKEQTVSKIKMGVSKLWKISNEKKYKQFLIQFILSNQNEFNKPPLSPNDNQQQQPNYNRLFDSLYQILFIKSNELQNRILDLDYFSNSYNMLYFKHCCSRLIQLSKSTVQLVLLYFRIYFKCKDQSDIPLDVQYSINEIIENNNNDDEQKKKLLLKLLISISGSKKLIGFYHSNYSELINGHLEIKTLKSENILLNTFYNIINGSEDGDEKINQIIKIINKFTIDYQNTNLSRFKQFINSIRNYIISTFNTKQDYENTIESIELKESLEIFDLPLVWDSILVEITNPLTINNGKLIIETKGSIDWISDFTYISGKNKITHNIKSIYYKKRSKGLVEFKTNELGQYSKTKIGNQLYGTCPVEYYFKSIPLYPIKWSEISNNPIKPLIDQLNLQDTTINESFQSNETVISNLIKEITCGDGTYQFKSSLIIHFIRQIESTIVGLSENEISSILTAESNLLNLVNIEELVQLLFNSIVEFDLNVCKFIYSQINFQQHLEQFNRVWQDSISNPKDKRLSQILFIIHRSICIDKTLTNEKSVKFIKFWIEIINSSSSISATTASTFKLILNYIFNKIISIAGISMNQVLSILELINESSITKYLMESPSIYHSFFYLNIKSPKLVKYIIDTTDLKYGPGRGYIDFDTCNYQYLIDLLNPNLFTLKYIINEPFDSILNYLVQFKYKHVEESKIKRHHQTNLNYYLQIKRMDLFFKEMELLKAKFNKKTNPFTFNFEFISRINEIPEFNQDCSLLDRFLIIEESISNEPDIYKKILSYSKRGKNNEILSFLINKYNVESISINNSINNVFIEYLCKFHPNVVLNSIKELTMFSTPYIETIDTLLKYFPNNYKITENNIKTAIDNSDFTILKYYKNKKVIN